MRNFAIAVAASVAAYFIIDALQARKRAADLAQAAASSRFLDQQYQEGWGYGD